MNKTKNNKKRIPKLALLSLAILILVGLSLGSYKLLHNEAPVKTTPATVNGIKFAPATSEEKQSAEDNKAAVVERDKIDSAGMPTADSKSVTPIISSWGQDPDTKNFELAAYVGTVYEDGGNCTLTFTKDNQTITKSITGRKDVNRTTCAPVTIPYAELSAGNWTATLNYTSMTASGNSKQQVITIN